MLIRNYEALVVPTRKRSSGAQTLSEPYSSFTGHLRLVTHAVPSSGRLLVSPNAQYIPKLPPNEVTAPTRRLDGRLATHETVFHPQYYSPERPYLPFVFWDESSSIDRDYILRAPTYGSSPTSIVSTGPSDPEGHMDVFYMMNLQKIASVEANRAEAVSKAVKLPFVFDCYPRSFQKALDALNSHALDSVENLQVRVAIIQRHVLECRALTAWVTLTRLSPSSVAYESGSHLPFLGSWVEESDSDSAKSLVFRGVPVWMERKDSPDLSMSEKVEVAPLSPFLTEELPQCPVDKVNLRRTETFRYSSTRNPRLNRSPRPSFRAPYSGGRESRRYDRFHPSQRDYRRGYRDEHSSSSYSHYRSRSRSRNWRSRSPAGRYQRLGTDTSLRQESVPPGSRPSPDISMEEEPSKDAEDREISSEPTETFVNENADDSRENNYRSPSPCVSLGLNSSPLLLPASIESTLEREEQGMPDAVMTELEAHPAQATPAAIPNLSLEDRIGEVADFPIEDYPDIPVVEMEDLVESLQLVPDPAGSRVRWMDALGRVIVTQVPLTKPQELLHFIFGRFENDHRLPFASYPYEKEHPNPLYEGRTNQYCMPHLEYFNESFDNCFLRKLTFLRCYKEWKHEAVNTKPESKGWYDSFGLKQRLRPRGHLSAFCARIGTKELTEIQVEELNSLLTTEQLPYIYPNAALWTQVLWELNTYHFRHEFELITYLKHEDLVSPQDKRDSWNTVLARVRRVWGFTLPPFPSYYEDRYLDSYDELVQLRHWSGLGRIMEGWLGLKAVQYASIRFALGGSVRNLRLTIMNIFTQVHSVVLEREAHTFYSRA